MFRLLRSILLAAFLVATTAPLVECTVSFEGRNYESIPARFGMEWQPRTRTYQAHLQFLPERPRLCNVTVTLDELVPPNDTLPIALLVERGNCTFEEKAWVAMQAYPTVTFLVVYDNEPEKSLVSMRETSSAKGIKLGMLFVSYEAGMALRTELKNQTTEEFDLGGPIIHLDGLDPLMYQESSLRHLHTWILIAMGGFFTFITVFGCLLVFVQLGVIPVNGAGQIILSPDAIRRVRRLLTREEVSRFLPGGDLNGRCPASWESQPTEKHHHIPDGGEPQSKSTIETTTVNPQYDPEEDQSCAVCLDELGSGVTGENNDGGNCNTLCLPCGHNFHLECIVPWLTERQANCPLCKFDLLDFLLSHDAKKEPKNGSKVSFTYWKQQVRRWWGWSPIQSSDSQGGDSSTSNNSTEDAHANASNETPI